MTTIAPASNPFDLHRAADFSDSQIIEYWVDYAKDGLLSLIEPYSPSAVHLLGGKGSGKTHLMRYCSFPVQRLRAGDADDIVTSITREGYIGVFTRANTFDTGRFQGKGQGSETWGVLFNYYFEIRICEKLVSILVELSRCSEKLKIELDEVVCDLFGLFDTVPDCECIGMLSLLDILVKIRKEIDVAVNNCAFTRSLDVKILASPGNLLFGIPGIISKKVHSLRSVVFAYLIDEVENFSKEKQRFINTLIRHRQGPVSVCIGARLYGLKTSKNYGSDEENKEGSEFRRVFLDQIMRSHEDYENFVKRLCVKRLVDAGVFERSVDECVLTARLDGFFETIPESSFHQEFSQSIVDTSGGGDRRYFRKLREQLRDGKSIVSDLGVNSEKDIDMIVELLRCSDNPLLEKVNIFLFYQAWGARKNLLEQAGVIERGCVALLRGEKDLSKVHKRVLGHFAKDFLAQMLRDYGQRTTAMYSGFNSFIKMSAGVPRNLLILLYNMYKWARFNGEAPFSDQPISIDTQREAILDSSVFYFEEDARPGVDVPEVRNVVARLAEYLREARFAAKPVEPSPLAFSIDESSLSEGARARLMQAENWSYVFRIGKGRPNANTQRVDAKYQLNPMLSPKWDLPIYVRGDVRLSPAVANAIFGEGDYDNFKEVTGSRVSAMNPPSFREAKSQRADTQQTMLPFDLGE